MDSKKLKSFIKGASAKETFGTNPLDPWSTKANISEMEEIDESASLNQYLMSRGINPKYVSMPTKVAHSKSAQFLKWKRDHMNMREESEATKKPLKKDCETPPKGNQMSVMVPESQDDEVKIKILTKNQSVTHALGMLNKVMKKKVVKEALYDHEKEDKSVATYGKKPKHDVADPKDSSGEKKPRAAAVLSGGTTLTGSKRDTVEIDPMMRVRPGQPDPTKKDDKTGAKKDDNKKDK